MDVIPSTLFDEFTPLMDTECSTFDEFDELLLKLKQEPPDFLTDELNKEFYDEPLKRTVKNEINFNPDEFLNYLQPTQTKLFYNGDERNTPSPTNSSTSSFSTESNSSNSNPQKLNEILDTPPISPNGNFILLSPKPVPQIMTTSQIIPQTIQFSHNNDKQQVIMPMMNPTTTLTSLSNKSKTIQVNNSKPVTNSRTPKTIILSQKDFKNLMERSKMLNSNELGPKIVIKHVNKPMVLPKIAPQQRTTNGTKDILPNYTQNLTALNTFVDEKTLKKHERMIKNRKSACLSRMKKKNYVSSLETKISSLEKENLELKNENNLLRNRLENCNCKYRENAFFGNTTTSTTTTPTILPNNFKNKKNFNFNKVLMGSTIRKNTTVLLAMLFMISINFGTINNFLKPSSIVNELTNNNNKLGQHYHQRNLLWINDTPPSLKNLNHTKSIIPTAIPLNSKKNSTNFPLLCPMSNQTENLRIATVLRKWIGTNDYLNLSTTQYKNENSMKYSKYLQQYEHRRNSPEFQTMFKDIENLDRKNYFNRNLLRKNKNKFLNNEDKNSDDVTTNSVQIYDPKLDDKYINLLKEIRRRNDTFYVVSFNTEHILLPASDYNKTSRPRMSLMLPAGDAMLNGKLTLIQIDCEVVNTTLVQLKKEFIPKNLRPTNKFNNNNKQRDYKRTTTSKFNDKNATTSNFNMNDRNFDNMTPTAIKNQQQQHNEFINNDDKKDKLNNHNNNIYKPYFLTGKKHKNGNKLSTT